MNNLTKLNPLKIIILLCCGLIIGGYAGVRHIHGFLSLNMPIKAEVLVVEGWIPDYALEKAAAHMAKNSYKLIVTTGGQLERGFFLSGYESYANLARATLSQLSNRHDIVAVSAPKVLKDRTYASARALKQWLKDNRPDLHKINLVSQDVHSRRSRNLFQKALGRDYAVGIISMADAGYNAERWWTSSEGFKTVVEETIAYLYALLAFPFTGEPAG